MATDQLAAYVPITECLKIASVIPSVPQDHCAADGTASVTYLNPNWYSVNQLQWIRCKNHCVGTSTLAW